MDKGVESGCEGKHRQLLVLLETEEGGGKCGEIKWRGHVCDGWEVCILDRSLQCGFGEEVPEWGAGNQLKEMMST